MRRWRQGVLLVLAGALLSLPALAAERDDHVQRGLSLMEQGAFQQASQEFRLALVKRPQDPDALFGLGFCLYRMTHYQEASTVYDQLLQDRSSPRMVAQARSGLGDAYLQMAMYPEAVAQYSRALATHPHWIGARLNLSRAWLGLGNFQAALDEVETVIESNPRLSEAFQVRSQARFGLGDSLLALNDLHTAVSLNAHLGRQAYLQLASLEGIHGQYAEGVRVAEKLLSERPDAQAWSMLGHLKLGWAQALLKQRALGQPANPGQHGDPDALLGEAIASLQRAVLFDPRDPAVRRQLRDAYLLSGEIRLAFHQAKELLRLATQDVEAVVAVSRLGMRLGLAEADDLAESVARHRPEHELAQRNWQLFQTVRARQPLPIFAELRAAEARFARGDYHGALALLPATPEGLALAGRWAHQRGDYARAVRALRWSTSWLPDPEGTYLLSDSYSRLGQPQMARQALRETLAMDRRFPGARQRYWSLLSAQ